MSIHLSLENARLSATVPVISDDAQQEMADRGLIRLWAVNFDQGTVTNHICPIVVKVGVMGCLSIGGIPDF